ncbi:B12-binding domain-containing radical SAM protein [Candidatus Albibeggiatoa sp. nov. NOAA]|uniref:B12-binding domain-containing radical SAM protein n=1 Tax=Candidatus Albibeggiatoa sp. nov. NOAA TaxID=3162724 RepID=UPI0032F99128|nr:B12-binding domain-containing radical SAM protein [Thiotrichaceae bacterium]
MRVLLILPRFPKSFWTYDKTMQLIGKKSGLPPLGLITVAALLPQDWEFKLVDRNIREITEAEWEWADMAMLSAMVVQKKDFLAQAKAAKQRGKKVAVGGPYATSFYPDIMHNTDIDYWVLDEGEMTIPTFLAALERDESKGVFRSTEKPDVTQTPIPRYDLLELDAYADMSIQFSRGCPFLCEFCDIITLYGRKPRTKTPEQMLRELDCLYELGWRGNVFMVDDNFIGNKRNVKQFLEVLKGWMEAKKYPFVFYTEASVDLARHPDLMSAMVECNFDFVFIGLETPDEASLAQIKKSQNLKEPLSESITTIKNAGIQVMAGFIIGFDGEQAGAGKRIVQFIEDTAIPIAMFTLLQALPNTALWDRLHKEQRLMPGGDINQTSLINFVPTRPSTEIADEYVEAFWQLYEPKQYLQRTYRHFMQMGNLKHRHLESMPFGWGEFKLLLRVLWLHGVVHQTRWDFWRYLYKIARFNGNLIPDYFVLCAAMEHFVDFRQMVREQITTQLKNA